MNLDFTSEQKMLRKSVAEFLAKECPYEHVKELEDSESGYSAKIWKKMAKLGWMEMFVPEAYGGLDDPFIDRLIIMEEIGKRAFPSPFFSTVFQCCTILVNSGTEEQKKEILPKIASGKIILALAQYEDDMSYREEGINMIAELSGDQYHLNGAKMFVLEANIADKLIVAAKTVEGTTLFLVDAGKSGITTTKMPSIGKDNTCRVSFENVRISRHDMIGNPGEGWCILEKMAETAVLGKCAEMLGGCAKAIELTAGYAKQRVQYETPIGAFQSIQHYMADMKIACENCTSYMYKIAWMIDEGMDAATDISALKAQVNEDYKFITDRAVHIHGGVGTTREFDVALFYRRAKAFEFSMGDTDYHYEKVAVGMGL